MDGLDAVSLQLSLECEVEIGCVDADEQVGRVLQEMLRQFLA
jgi:hypothetical protein